MRIRDLLGICLLLAVAGQLRGASGETEYFAVFMEGQKAGYAIQSRVAAGGKVTTTEEVSLEISRLGVPLTTHMTETHVETIDGKPLGFEVIQELSGMVMKMVGVVDEQGTINLTTAEQKITLEWPNGALMAEGLRLIQLKKGLKEGLSYTVKVFSPSAMQAIDTQIRIGPKKDVDLLGRVVTLTEVSADFNMPGGGRIVSNSYVDEELRVQKETSSIMRIMVEMIACAKEFALGDNDVPELIGKMFVASAVPLTDVSSAKSITYHLSPAADAIDLKIPSSNNQIVKASNNGKVIVTVSAAAAPEGARFPYKGEDKTILAAMKPTRFVQSNNKQIIRLARNAVDGTKDAGEAVRRIEAFVAKYMENKGLSVGYASAAEVAASKQGDCTEFAVLTAALCRAVGIPAQVVTGVAYVKDFAGLEGFGGHAWVQAYVGDRWIGLDAAFKSAGLQGYDPGHIALAVGNGDPEDFFSLAGILGQFKIDKAVVNKSK